MLALVLLFLNSPSPLGTFLGTLAHGSESPLETLKAWDPCDGILSFAGQRAPVGQYEVTAPESARSLAARVIQDLMQSSPDFQGMPSADHLLEGAHWEGSEVSTSLGNLRSQFFTRARTENGHLTHWALLSATPDAHRLSFTVASTLVEQLPPTPETPEPRARISHRIYSVPMGTIMDPRAESSHTGAVPAHSVETPSFIKNLAARNTPTLRVTNASEFDGFLKLAVDAKRRLPLVVVSISPSFRSLDLSDLATLEERLSGFAQLVVLQPHGSGVWRRPTPEEAEWIPNNGAVAVQMPRPTGPSSPRNRVYFLLPSNSGTKAGFISAIVHRARWASIGMGDIGSTPESTQRLRHIYDLVALERRELQQQEERAAALKAQLAPPNPQEELSRLQTENSRLTQELAGSATRIRSLENQLASANNEAAIAFELSVELDQMVKALEVQLAKIQLELSAAQAGLNAKVQKAPPPTEVPPTNLLTALEIALNESGGKLVATERASRGAKKYDDDGRITPDDLLKALRGLAGPMWDAYFGDDPQPSQAQDLYYAATGIEVGFSEGPQTHKNSRFARLREDEFEGLHFEAWPHIKMKSDSPIAPPRVHFYVDRKNRRIIVSYVGEHMKNASSHKVK